MDIDGLGEEVIDQLLKAKLVKNFADLYELKENELANLTHSSVTKDGKEIDVRLGEKTARQILDSIEQSKARGLARVLGSLGIRHIGAQTALIISSNVAGIDKLLTADEESVRRIVSETRTVSKLQSARDIATDFFEALHSTDGASRLKKAEHNAKMDRSLNVVKIFLDDLPDGGSTWRVKWGTGSGKKDLIFKSFDSLDALKKATVDELTRVFDLESDEVVGRSLFDFLHSKKGRDTITRLQKVEVSMKSLEMGNSRDNLPLAGKIFVVTGTLEKYSRDEIQELIRANGGKATSSVSRSTDYLIAGENAGSKLEKAKRLNVQTISEQKFLDLLAKSPEK